MPLELSLGAARAPTSLAVVAAVLVSVAALGVGLFATPRGRTAALTTLATLSWVPVTLLLFEQLVRGNARHYLYDGSGCHVALSADGSLVFALFLGIAGAWLLASLGAALARRGALDSVLRRGAVLVVVASGLLTAVGFESRHPDLDRYPSTMTVERALAVGDSFTTRDGTRVTYERTRSGNCVFAWLGGAAPASDGCTPMQLRHDGARDTWLIEGTVPISPGAGPARSIRFKGHEGRPCGFEADDLAGALGLPRAWTVGAFAGALFGVVCLYLGLRRGKRPLAFDTEGTLSSDGWVTLPGGQTLRLSGAGPVDAGPVVVRLGAPSTASYRDDASPSAAAWRPGTLEALHDERQSRAACLLASALCAPLLCGAPLLFGVLAGWR
jgi:hypothetical protein